MDYFNGIPVRSGYEKWVRKLAPKVSVDLDTGCWNWRGGSRKNGYGQASVGGRLLGSKSTHWLIFTALVRDIPRDLVLRHQCHNRLCCNPEHILLGTHQDNMNDSIISNRVAKGESHGCAILREDIVRKIISTPGTAQHIASQFGASIHVVRKIKSGALWKHLDRSLLVPLSNGCKKLTADLVIEIRSSDEPVTALANRLGVNRTTIHQVRKYRTWKHLDQEVPRGAL